MKTSNLYLKRSRQTCVCQAIFPQEPPGLPSRWMIVAEAGCSCFCCWLDGDGPLTDDPPPDPSRPPHRDGLGPPGGLHTGVWRRGHRPPERPARGMGGLAWVGAGGMHRRCAIQRRLRLHRAVSRGAGTAGQGLWRAAVAPCPASAWRRRRIEWRTTWAGGSRPHRPPPAGSDWGLVPPRLGSAGHLPGDRSPGQAPGAWGLEGRCQWCPGQRLCPGRIPGPRKYRGPAPAASLADVYGLACYGLACLELG